MDIGNGLHFMIRLLVTLSLVSCQNISDATSENSTEINLTTPDSEKHYSYDYVVKLLFYVNEEKIPEYVIKLIYSNSSENNITVRDIISLYGANDFSLSQTEGILQKLNIQTSNVLSMNGLDTFMREFNVQFQDFYNTILVTKLKVSGLPLKNFLIALGIDNSKFTEGMAYAEPDPYEEFKKGNFSQASLENALKIINRTSDELFVAFRDELVGKAVNRDTKNIIEILERYNFDSKKAMQLWTFLNITISQLENIQAFNNSLNKLRNDQNTKMFLGIVSDENRIATNKIVYDTWQENSFSKMYAEQVTSTDRKEIEGLSTSITDNIISLNLNGSLNTSFPILETSLVGMVDCIFVTLLNDTILSEAVMNVTAEGEYIDVIMQKNRTNIVWGSPLICGGKVYGLAAHLVDTNHVRFDSFYKNYENSSAIGLAFNEYLLVICVSLLWSRY